MNKQEEMLASLVRNPTAAGTESQDLFTKLVSMTIIDDTLALLSGRGTVSFSFSGLDRLCS